MILKQISVSLKNKPGSLSKVSDILGDARVNVQALTVNYGSPFSTLRVVVDNPEKALDTLEAAGLDIDTQEVLAIETPDHPGGLNAILKPFKDAEINVLYLYPYIGKYQENAILVLGVDKTEEAIKVLNRNYIRIMDKELLNLQIV